MYNGKVTFTILGEAEGKRASFWEILNFYQKNRDGWISQDYVHKI